MDEVATADHASYRLIFVVLSKSRIESFVDEDTRLGNLTFVLSTLYVRLFQDRRCTGGEERHRSILECTASDRKKERLAIYLQLEDDTCLQVGAAPDKFVV